MRLAALAAALPIAAAGNDIAGALTYRGTHHVTNYVTHHLVPDIAANHVAQQAPKLCTTDSFSNNIAKHVAYHDTQHARSDEHANRQDFIHIAFWHRAGTNGFVTAATVFEHQDADIGI